MNQILWPISRTQAKRIVNDHAPAPPEVLKRPVVLVGYRTPKGSDDEDGEG